MTTAEPIRATLLESLRAWNAGDYDAYYAHFAPDVVFRGPGGTETAGVEALRATFDAFCTQVPGLQIDTTLVAVDAEARVVASVHRFHGSAAGAGAPFEARGMTFLRVGSDGLIAELYESMEVQAPEPVA